MRKRILITTILILTIGLTSVVFAATGGMFELCDSNIKIGNSNTKLQYPIYMNDNRIYVSLRNICDELGIPIEWDGEKNEVVMDIYNRKVEISDKTSFKEEGVIPDEQTALIIGKTILEKYAERNLEYETDDKIYYLTVEFDKQYNGWRVSQTFEYKEKAKGWAVGGGFCVPYVVLNKQTGEVLYINTSSMFLD